jgi:hypothetical protein
MYNLREILVRATRKHLEGHLDKHLANIEVLLTNPAGIGEHQDIMEAIELELEQASKYEDMINTLENYIEE